MLALVCALKCWTYSLNKATCLSSQEVERVANQSEQAPGPNGRHARRRTMSRPSLVGVHPPSSVFMLQRRGRGLSCNITMVIVQKRNAQCMPSTQ